MSKIKVTISGDFCITDSHLSRKLFPDELISIFNDSDLNITNLECPVVEDNAQYKILKTGPHLRTSDKIFEHLKNLNIGLVTLANNHIMDYGANGLMSTIHGCKSNNISVVGAGNTKKEAAEPYILDKNGYKLAILNFCENEWSVAQTDAPGANPMDVIDNVYQIQKARELADFVLVIIHGGHEYYNLPSPRMVKQYRYYAENGADMIVGHHPHCISGYEIHKGIPIFYSLGNFIFTKPSKKNVWYTGLVLKLDIDQSNTLSWDIIAVKQSMEDHFVTPINGDQLKEVMAEIENYKMIIGDKKKLYDNWLDFIHFGEKYTLQIFSPTNSIPNKYLVAILRRLGINRFLLRKRYLAALINNIRCEALYDAGIQVLKNKLNQNNENRSSS